MFTAWYANERPGSITSNFGSNHFISIDKFANDALALLDFASWLMFSPVPRRWLCCCSSLPSFWIERRWRYMVTKKSAGTVRKREASVEYFRQVKTRQIHGIVRRTAHNIYHESERREDNPMDPLIRVIARQSQHLIQERPVIKPCTDKHLHEGRRDTWEGDFEQEHRESLCRIHCSVAFFATQFLDQRVACEQSEYTGWGARFEGDLVIKCGATENTAKRDCKECGASRVSSEGEGVAIAIPTARTEAQDVQIRHTQSAHQGRSRLRV